VTRLSWTAFAACILVGCKDSVEPLDLAGTPASITAASGDNQRGVAGSALGSALTVTVTDADGRPSPGVVVQWEVTGGIPPTTLDAPRRYGRFRRRRVLTQRGRVSRALVM
jgi:hypothetical protein